MDTLVKHTRLIRSQKAGIITYHPGSDSCDYRHYGHISANALPKNPSWKSGPRSNMPQKPHQFPYEPRSSAWDGEPRHRNSRDTMSQPQSSSRLPTMYSDIHRQSTWPSVDEENDSDEEGYPLFDVVEPRWAHRRENTRSRDSYHYPPDDIYSRPFPRPATARTVTGPYHEEIRRFNLEHTGPTAPQRSSSLDVLSGTPLHSETGEKFDFDRRPFVILPRDQPRRIPRPSRNAGWSGVPENEGNLGVERRPCRRRDGESDTAWQGYPHPGQMRGQKERSVRFAGTEETGRSEDRPWRPEYEVVNRGTKEKTKEEQDRDVEEIGAREAKEAMEPSEEDLRDLFEQWASIAEGKKGMEDAEDKGGDEVKGEARSKENAEVQGGNKSEKGGKLKKGPKLKKGGKSEKVSIEEVVET